MADDLMADVQDAIQRNLPAQIGTHLLERLKKADADAKEVQALQAKAERLTKEKEEVAKQLASQQDAEARLAKLQREAAEIDEKRKTLLIDQATLVAEKQAQQQVSLLQSNRVNDLKELLATLFANNQVKRKLTEETPVFPVKDQYGALQYPSTQQCGAQAGPTKTETVEG